MKTEREWLERICDTARIVDVFMPSAESNTHENPRTWTGKLGARLTSEVEVCVHDGLSSDKELSFDVKFKFQAQVTSALKGTSSSQLRYVATITATFITKYKMAVSEDDGVWHGSIEAKFDYFAKTTAMNMVWPYWREYCQSMMVRMQIPVMPFSVFKRVPKETRMKKGIVYPPEAAPDAHSDVSSSPEASE